MDICHNANGNLNDENHNNYAKKLKHLTNKDFNIWKTYNSSPHSIPLIKQHPCNACSSCQLTNKRALSTLLKALMVTETAAGKAEQARLCV